MGVRGLRGGIVRIGIRGGASGACAAARAVLQRYGGRRVSWPLHSRHVFPVGQR